MYRILVFILLFSSSIELAFSREDATEIPANIHSIFPNATRVGETHSDIPVTPVYQLQQLLGYVFESIHFADFIGFSGKPINVLIGLDEGGNFVDLKVIDHSEPIFLHGLGERSLFQFIQQYKTHNIREHFVVGGKGNAGSNATYFDGVTKATVSVLVINDTIVTSALAVARAKLDGFVQPSTKIVNPDFYKPMDFVQLVDAGYVVEHTIYQQDIDDQPSEIVTAASDYPVDESGVFSRHYYAFLSIPIVGKNLLTDSEYARLQDNLNPGEIALGVFATEGYAFVSEEFIPQTAPEYLRIQQSDFPIDARDEDFYSFYEPSFKTDLPEYTAFKILKIKSQGGLSLDQALDISIALPYSPSFFERAEHLFTKRFVLPESLFMENPEAMRAKPPPLWVQMWQSRWVEVGITGIYLLMITVFFIYQNKLMRYTKWVHAFRATSLVFVLGFIGLYAQGQLSVVNIYTLLLDLVDGFTLQMYLLDPVIFVLWSFVFVSLFLFGRGLYCGWLCPFGALQEMMAMLANKLGIKQIRIKPQHHKRAQYIKYVLLVGLVGLSFYSLSWAEKLAEIEPFKTAITLYFVRYWPFVLYAVVLLLLSLKVHKVYCRYLCPLGAGFAVLGRFPIFKLLRRREECGSPCQLCKQKKCGIDAINQDGSIDYAECVQCMECVVTLENPEICKIDKYKKKKVRTRVKTIDPVSA
jgi:transcriptional regulator of nitric oxide reductase